MDDVCVEAGRQRGKVGRRRRRRRRRGSRNWDAWIGSDRIGLQYLNFTVPAQL
jgi:hypothetical protein